MNKTIVKSPIKIKENKLNYSGANIFFTSHKVPLTQGYNYVKLIDLPLTERDEVYFKNTNNKGFEILSVERLVENRQSEKLNRISQHLKDKQIEIDSVETEIEVCNYKLNLYRKAFTFDGDIDDHTLVDNTVNKYAKLTEVERKKLNELKTQLNELHNSYEEIKHQYLTTKEEKQQNIMLKIYSEKDQEVEILGHINTYSIFFVPRYTFQGNTQNNTANLLLEAVIKNNLNYRFKDCNVTFEFRDNNNYDIVPNYVASDFDSLLHDIFGLKATPRPLARALKASQMMSYDCENSKHTNATNHVYRITKEVTIPERSHDNVITLEQNQLNGSFKYVTLPSVNNNVYLTYKADVKDFSLIDSANILINVDDTFIPLSRFEINNNEMTITIKKVDFLKVKRTSTSKHTCNLDQDSDTSVEINYNIIIENTSDKDVDVNVIESLPKSNNDDIKVRIIHPEANDITHDELTNSDKLDKVYSVKSHDKVDINIDYEITGKIRPLLNF